MASKALPPNHESFFPRIFLRNQFRAKRPPLPPSANLRGQVAIITGGNVGLGLESAKQLLALQLSHLILAVRTVEKGEAAATLLRKQAPSARIEVWKLDMCSYESIQSFASQAAAKLVRLDFVILNAGVSKADFGMIQATGHEETIQVNYFSTVLLGILLLPILESKRGPSGEPGRLIMVNSGLALMGKLPLDAKKPDEPILPAFDDKKNFNGNTYYNTSKTLMHAFLWKLTDYVSADQVIVTVVDPGFCKGTGLQRDLSVPVATATRAFAAATARSMEVGASTYVDAAVAKGKESHGAFLMSWKIEPFFDPLYATDGYKLVERVWEETMQELKFAGAFEILEEMEKR